MLSHEFCTFFNNTYFGENPRATGSVASFLEVTFLIKKLLRQHFLVNFWLEYNF